MPDLHAPPPVTIIVHGRPAPQGSKRGYAIRKNGVPTGRVAIVEQQHDRVRSWRQAVLGEADRLGFAVLNETDGPGWLPLDGPLALVMTFYLPRPKSHHRTGRNCHLLRRGAPRLPGAAPDIDKLARATSDALTDAGIWRDDAQVTDCHLSKRYADGDQVPGALITIRTAT